MSGNTWHCVPCERDYYGPVISHAVYHPPTAGETAHPNRVWTTYSGHPLIGPCDNLRCRYASKPGGDRHEGKCSDE